MRPAITIVGVVALCVGVGLLSLGVHKLFDFQGFTYAVKLHGLVGSDFLIVAAVSFVALETLCGFAAVALVVLDRARIGLVICAALVMVTAAYSTALVFRPPAKPAPCGCGFSSMAVKDWRQHAATLWVVCGVLLGVGAVARKNGERAFVSRRSA